MRLHERMRAIGRFVLLAAALAPLAATARSAGGVTQIGGGEFLVYVGTYTGHESKGIYAYRFDARRGKLTALGLAAETANPSFLAVHPNHRFLYAVNEGHKGTVSAFSIDAITGKLTFLNKVSSRGSEPCYIAVDKSGKTALVANYGDGIFAALPIRDDGRLADAASFSGHAGLPVSGLNRKRQDRPHAHAIDPSPDNRFALGADLGLDKIFIYKLDAARASLTPAGQPFAQVERGAGPRHLAFHPSARFVYAVNELNSTVTVFGYGASDGTLKEIQRISTLPKDYTGENYPAEIQVHPNGKFLYVSNRGHDSITVFGIDRDSGKLTPVQQVSTKGRWPRHLALDPSGVFLFVANQNSGNVVVFHIDAATGQLRPAGQSFELHGPVCVRFVPVQ